MKKWTAGILGAILTIGITACGNNETTENTATGNTPAATTEASAPAASAEASAPAATEEAATGVPTVDELIKKSTEAGQSLKSFAMDAQIIQKISITQGETTQDQNSDMKMKSEFIKNPLQMHQVVQMVVPGQEGEQTVEQYITADGSYSHAAGQWMKLPAEMTAPLKASMEQSASPEKQLEQFKTLSKETKITEEGDNYLLTADVSGENVKELAKSFMSQSGGADAQMTALLDQMNIKSMKIIYAVNKETYLPAKTNVDMVMDMAAEGQNISLDMKMSSDISKHNEIADFKIPDEALKAQEAQMPTTPQQ
ncbi:hypothetical protein GCM10010912_31690 [Paenibacillus albidus]|uniref:LppX_LprAFG lipoprotein n=1 Tax=Paenibacillus albidus TaxID=2041023 RepID=A0A917CCD0_9BACL|nr:DUF6612 family protein [Paenibacillus albidus]GGF84131.1 hypothetical protein GCM10010912_31690 [Paenibacillus albidus]